MRVYRQVTKLKVPMTEFLIFLLDSTQGSDLKSIFPSPCFSCLKMWNFTSSWVKNHIKWETEDSVVGMRHREHIDIQNKRELRDCS